MKCLVDMVDVRNSDPTTASDKRASEGSLIRDDSVYCFDARGVYNMVSTLKSSVGHAASIVNPCRPATQHPELLSACKTFLRQQHQIESIHVVIPEKSQKLRGRFCLTS